MGTTLYKCIYKCTQKTIKDITFLLKNTTNNEEDDSQEQVQESIEEFTQLVDVPLHSTIDNTTTKSTKQTKYFIQSNHSREGDSYRSPWTNEYDPPLANDDGMMGSTLLRPSPPLRELEIQANEVFETYTHLYYGVRSTTTNAKHANKDVVSSVYFWDKRSGGGGGATGAGDGRSGNSNVFKRGFGGCFLIRKEIDLPNEKGYWNSIHHVDFGPIVNGRSCKYALSTTVVLSMDVIPSPPADSTAKKGSCDTSCGKNSIHIDVSLSKEVEQTKPIKDPTDHISNIGGMMEDVEIELRTNMDVLYIQKTKEIIDSLRPSGSFDGPQRSSRGGRGGGGLAALMMGGGMPGLPAAAQNEMNAALMARFKKSNPS